MENMEKINNHDRETVESDSWGVEEIRENYEKESQEKDWGRYLQEKISENRIDGQEMIRFLEKNKEDE